MTVSPLLATLSSMADGRAEGWVAGGDVDARAEALDVLFDVQQWRLADARWQAIGQVLIAMEAALRADDAESLAVATADLELAGPLRVTRIGATPVVPPTPQVLDVLNRLVHSLGGITAGQQQEAADNGPGDDRHPRN